MHTHNHVSKAVYHAVIFCCFIFTFTLLALPASAESGNDWTNNAETSITNITKQLKSFNTDHYDTSLLPLFDKQVSGFLIKAQTCVNDKQPQVNKLKSDIARLSQNKDQSRQAGHESSLDTLNQLANTAESQLKTCQAILISAQNLSDTIHHIETNLLTRYLLSHGEPVTTVLHDTFKSVTPLVTSLKTFLDTRIKITSFEIYDLLIFAVAVLAAWFLGVLFGKKLLSSAARIAGKSITEGLIASLYACLGKVFPLLLASSAAAATAAMLLPLKPMPVSTAAFSSFTVYLLITMVVRILLWPCKPAEHVFELDPEFARSLYKRLQFLLALALIALFSFSINLKGILTHSQWELVRISFMALTVINIAWLISYLERAPGLLGNELLRSLVILTLLISVAAELGGYRNLAGFLYRGTLGSIVLGIGLWVLHALLQDILDSLNEGRHNWGRRLRESLKLKKNQPIPGLLWIRILSVLLIWMFFVISMLQIWQYSDNGWNWFLKFVQGGFVIGNIRIVPVQIAMGIILFSVLLTFVRWFRQNTLPKWVRNAGFDRGGREAVVTISGYVGVLISALLGLSVAGFDFTNLAIIAGALSVGIGFGLQNIVNNFVSGLILLFERPIRTGDWIIVGNTEGFVRKISIRSTQIETFDHADVIVPNSELIANQVTNWMLHDAWGRIIVPVGVAYGTDVRKVERILIDCAMNHPLVIKDSDKVNPPMVRFCGFGNSSLDFELRAFISAIEKRFITESDLNFAIEQALRENSIEIPFPQRDLHLRSVDPSIVFSNRKTPE